MEDGAFERERAVVRRGHDRSPGLEKARSAHEVGLLLAEDVLRILRPAAAGRGVECLDRLAVEGQDLARRLEDGGVRERPFGGEPAVYLAGRSRAEVVAL